MKLIPQPNRWSCSLASFAMLFDMSCEKLIQLVGHDGSEIRFPNLPDPMCRRAFHPQEFAIAGLACGLHTVNLYYTPVGGPQRDSIVRLDMREIVESALKKYQAVIAVDQPSGKGHMVAWDCELVFDPVGVCYPYELLIRRGAVPRCVWLLV